MNIVPALTFQGHEFTVIKNGDQVCITLSEIAKVLYGKGEAQSDTPFEHRLKKLYRRHADEFTDSMTALVKMQTPGGSQDVRVFSLRGAHLLGMFARTETAKEFRRWALDVIDEHIECNRSIVPKYHEALSRLTTEKAKASIHGKGLNDWRLKKSPLESNLQQIADLMQPSLFLN